MVMVRALAFLATFALLQLAWQLQAAAGIHKDLIHAGVVVPAAFVADRLTPDLAVRAEGTLLRASKGCYARSCGINIVNGCDGTDVLFLLLAAFAVAPIEWRARLIGALTGAAIVYGLNQLRILALFYALGTNAELFDLLHGYLAPVLMVVLIVAYFHGWISRAAARRQPAV